MAIITIPEGSRVEVISYGNAETFLGDAGLNNLADDASTSTITYTAPSGSSYAKIIILLGKVNVTSTGSISLEDGVDTYELEVATGNVFRRVEFNNIPVSFIDSFSIKNNLGVALAAGGNSVTIIPL